MDPLGDAKSKSAGEVSELSKQITDMSAKWRSETKSWEGTPHWRFECGGSWKYKFKWILVALASFFICGSQADLPRANACSRTIGRKANGFGDSGFGVGLGLFGPVGSWKPAALTGVPA